MADDTDLAFRRYSAALRRWWWLVLVGGVLLAVVLGATGAGSGVGTGTIVEARFSVPESAGVFGGVVESPPQPRLSFRAFSDLLAGPKAQAEVEDRVGDFLDVTVRGLDESRIIVVTLRGSDAGILLAGADAYLEYAQELRRGDFAAVADEVRTVLIQQRAIVDARIAELDAELETIPVEDARAPRVEALQSERVTLAEKRVELDLAAQFVDDVESGTAISITEIDRDQRDGSTLGATIFRFVVGFLAGAVLTMVGIIVFVSFSRRVRTAADVNRIAGDGAVIGHSGTNVPLSSLAALAMARRSEDGTLYVFGVGGANTVRVRNAIEEVRSTRDGANVVDGGSLADGEEGGQLAAVDGDGAGALLVVRENATRTDQLEYAVRAIRVSGIGLVGIVMERG